MRKLSLLSSFLVITLIVGLVGATAMAANDTANITLGTESSISIQFTGNSGNIDLDSFDQLSDQTWNDNNDKTSVQVKSTEEWKLSSITKTASVDTGDIATSEKAAVENHFTVTPESDYSVGTNKTSGTHNFDVTYGWNAVSAGTLAGGNTYTVAVEFTVSTV